MNFTLPAGTFTDIETASLTLSASGLPAWLNFNAATDIYGTAPLNFNGFATSRDGDRRRRPDCVRYVPPDRGR